MIIHSDAELVKPPAGKMHPNAKAKIQKAVNRSPQGDVGMGSPNSIDPKARGDVKPPKDRVAIEQPAISNPNNLDAVEGEGFSPPNDIASESQSAPDGPNNIPATPAEQMPAPNNLTPNAAGTIGLNHGRIGYVNHTFTSSFDATSSPETAAAISTPSTWERWQPVTGGAQEITITFTENKTVNYIGLAGYDLAGATVAIQSSSGLTGSFDTIETLTDFDAPSRMILLNEFSARRVKLIVTRTEPISLGVVYLGEALALQRATRGGVTPAPLNQMTSYNTEFSAAGQILGRVINSEGVETKVSLRNLTDDWYRSDFQSFVKAAKTTPFFYLWNPRDYPSDCIYGVSSKDIAPTLQGGKKFMDVSFNIEGV